MYTSRHECLIEEWPWFRPHFDLSSIKWHCYTYSKLVQLTKIVFTSKANSKVFGYEWKCFYVNSFGTTSIFVLLQLSRFMALALKLSCITNVVRPPWPDIETYSSRQRKMWAWTNNPRYVTSALSRTVIWTTLTASCRDREQMAPEVEEKTVMSMSVGFCGRVAVYIVAASFHVCKSVACGQGHS